MENERATEPRTGFYILPLLISAGVGFLVGRFIGIGGVAGTLVGAFICDALQELQGTRRLAAELQQVFAAIRAWSRRSSKESIPTASEDELERSH